MASKAGAWLLLGWLFVANAAAPASATTPLVGPDADVPAAEKQALLDLYAATKGSLWTTNTGWSTPSTTPVCQWHGVTCNEGGCTPGTVCELCVTLLLEPLPARPGSCSVVLGVPRCSDTVCLACCHGLPSQQSAVREQPGWDNPTKHREPDPHRRTVRALSARGMRRCRNRTRGVRVQVVSPEQAYGHAPDRARPSDVVTGTDVRRGSGRSMSCDRVGVAHGRPSRVVGARNTGP